MTNSYTLIIIISVFFGLLISSANTSGVFELLITSPKTVLIEPTVCPNFQCSSPNELAPILKVEEGVDLLYQSAQYQGEARKHIDVHLIVVEPSTNGIIAKGRFRLLADNEWSTQLIITTSYGFNVTAQLRNKCDHLFYGKRCGIYCIPVPDRHWACSAEGERKCVAGWANTDCSTPVCYKACNERGQCVSPNKCACIKGFNGTGCEQCIPRAGCLHGECLNNNPYTCKCKHGYIGAKCDIDINICSILKPCSNEGQCSIDSSSPKGYRCECPFGFSGSTCEVPSVPCSTTYNACQNGGICFPTEEKTVQCMCSPGFAGNFCEMETFEDGNSIIFLEFIYLFGIVSIWLFICKLILSDQCRIPSALSPATEPSVFSPSYKDSIKAKSNQTATSSDKKLDMCLDYQSPPPPYSSLATSRAYETISIDEDQASFCI